MPQAPAILWFDEVGLADIARVGGKNASLGEMIRALGAAGVRVPPGFATTADAYRGFVAENELADGIGRQLARFRAGQASLQETGHAIRQGISAATLPPDFARALRAAYRELGRRCGRADPPVAVRSSATAEDLPDASFAGQLESFLNVRGERALIAACRRAFASLFTDRAISYREAKGFAAADLALSVGVQQMVRSDLAGSGVMFSIDTESGFPRTTTISAAWGLGEPVVQGEVEPDRYLVFKPLLDRPGAVPIIEKACGRKAFKLVYGQRRATRRVTTTKAERARFVLADADILELARWSVAVERHYGRPMDMEWAKDGESGLLFLVQARPETVAARKSTAILRNWTLETTAKPVLEGAAVGAAVAAGRVCLVRSPDRMDRFPDGAILVARDTDPDWVPLMRRAAGIVTDHGGATSHAAIVSRELGVPAVVGTGAAMRTLADGQAVTVSCAGGETGRVYDGVLPFTSHEIDLAALPATRTQVMVNMAEPASAFDWWRLPARGVGLARMEFIIADHIRVHPMALLEPERTGPRDRHRIERLIAGHASGADYFVDTLARGIARLAAPFHPHPAIVRLSDFKTDEYAALLGGESFEPVEANPMIGFRGAARYCDPRYAPAFALECRALVRVREEMGFDNVVVMVPFCRTVAEADAVLAALADNGLARGERGLQIYVMCEIPANVILADRFAHRFDGFSIGSNDLTQLTLGIDRGSALLARSFDARDEAVTRLVAQAIAACHAAGIRVGICGQAPAAHPDFAAWLVREGIDSLSLDPASFAAALPAIAAAEGAVGDTGDTAARIARAAG